MTNNNLPYQTSKDYKELKRLLDEGIKIVGITDYKRIKARDICIAKRIGNYYSFSVRGCTYFDWYPDMKNTFEQECKEENFEYLVPTIKK